MSEKSREHIHPVMLNATFYVGITKLEARLECSMSAAILYVINEGLLKEGVISQEDHDLLKQRYGRKLKDVVAEAQVRRENSHISKLELERQKRELCQASARKTEEESQLEKVNVTLKGSYEQWSDHDLAWKIKTLAYAKKYPELEYARLIIVKEKDCDIISRETEAS